MAGDTTLNLLWRLQNGEGPAALSPRVAIVLIGTNDITNPVYNLVSFADIHIYTSVQTAASKHFSRKQHRASV